MFPIWFLVLQMGLVEVYLVVVDINHNSVSQIYIKDKQSVVFLHSYYGMNCLM